MTQYYIFSSQALAQAAIDKIDFRAREIARALGRLDANGNLIGRNAATGDLVPEAVTTTWVKPAKRLDGQWAVLHPNNGSMWNDPIAGGQTVGQYITQDLAAEVVAADPADGTWFPLPTPRGGKAR